ncbi:MAG: hypothetical protein CVU69_09750 [Deltaproteobacteria bacterium HGW-Deltaproteobacteria-4]|nr:MAG: hypothetical protein CVU69_09750 [Deltaproteobacteria bacterium HGW-Deltaproteobacteria-4]
MAVVPTVEAVLLEVVQSLGLDDSQTRTKKKFAQRQMKLNNHLKMLEELILDIFRELKLDNEARHHLRVNIADTINFNLALEQSIWTAGADQRQVLWYLLGYSYIPMLGRTVAFWQLDSITDKGMPGGCFWYLPQVKKIDGKEELILPFVATMAWLSDLHGLSMNEFTNYLSGGFNEDKGTSEDNADSIESNLYKWQEGSLPRAKTIDLRFLDNCELPFKGCFEPEDTLDLSAKIHAAKAFIEHKGLTADALRDEIPMCLPGCIEAVLSGDTSEEVQKLFVELLAIRYARPSMQVIRQRLQIARAVQDGYSRLVKVLCPKMEDCDCTDPAKNKVLQLTILFQQIYNLTIQAHSEGGSWEEEDAWFEEQTIKQFPWLIMENLHSILPSSRMDGKFLPLYLGTKFSIRFALLEGGEPLEDFLPFGKESAVKILERNFLRIEEENRGFDCREKLLIDLKHGSSWRTLQKFTHIDVLISLANDEQIPEKVRKIITDRMKELAQTSVQKIRVNLEELGHYLNGARKGRSKDCADLVAAILHEAENNPVADRFKAPLLQFKAKHALAQNDFSTAEQFFREALEDCHVRSYGTLRGEISRDLWSVAVSGKALIPENHEKYYRNAVFYDIIDPNLSMEDVAVEVAEYFWTDLYKPYPGVDAKTRYNKKETEAITSELATIIEQNDVVVFLDAWCKKHSNLKDRRLFDVRGDTVLNRLIKMCGEISKRLKASRIIQPQSHSEFENSERYIEKWNFAIGYIAQKWPKLLDIADFKAQTPLMLAVENKNIKLAKIFIEAGANLNLQDFVGQTALYGACRGREVECVRLLLSAGINTELKTVDSQTVLHTAVRFGHPEIVETILEHNPELSHKKNDQDVTPLEFLDYAILPDLKKYTAFMMSDTGSRTGTEADYKKIIEILTSSRKPQSRSVH